MKIESRAVVSKYMLNKSTTIGVVSLPGNIPGLYVEKMLKIISQQGVSASRFRQTHAIFANLSDDINLSEVEFDYDEYADFVNSVLEEFDIDGLGLLVGKSFRMTDFGILGYSILSSACLRDSLSIIERYQQLWGGVPNLYCSHTLGLKVSSQKEISRLPPGRLQQFELEEAVAQFLAIKDLLEEPDAFRLLKVTFSFPKPTYANLFTDIFDCPVYFDHEYCELFFPSDLLDQPFIAANALAQEICEQQCEKIFRKMEDKGGISEQIRTAIISSPSAPPSLTDFANDMHMSQRTLRRKLRAEGSTYQEILMETRLQMAQQYILDSQLSVKQIGYMLGYTEVANFQRAFKKWFELTPSEMRNQQKP